MPTETNHEAQSCPEPPERGEQINGPSLIQLLSLLTARMRLISGMALAGAALAAGIALMLPNTYTATAIIMPPQREQSAASMLLGQLGPLAAAAGADLGLKNAADLYVGILGSRTIADSIIRQFDLKHVYRTKTDTDTRNRLKARARFRAGRDSLIRVDVEDVDPKRAAAIANAFVAELEQQNNRLAITVASQRRQFLESELRQAKSDLTAAEIAMKTTQQKTGLIEVNGQTQVAIGSLAQLRAQMTAGEVALARLRMGATSANPSVIQAESELAAMRQQLQKMERGPENGAIVATSAIPEAGLDYLRRLRDLKYHELLFELLSKQYEAARLDEGNAGPAIQTVDFAVPPDRKTGPHRMLITLVGCLLGGAAAGTLVYVQYLRSSATSVKAV